MIKQATDLHDTQDLTRVGCLHRINLVSNLVSLLGCGGRVGSAWVLSGLCQAAIVAVPVTSVQVVNRLAIAA
jgi:hypothetical protein